jgi:SAM-dependent methyltransferase/SOS-response transcriptional repressor LexA
LLVGHRHVGCDWRSPDRREQPPTRSLLSIPVRSATLTPTCMDLRTVQFYAGHAAELARRYVAAGSAPARHFPVAFTPGSLVLDIGCGSGRDLNALLEVGYDANGIDACDDMLQQARGLYPAMANRLSIDTLPNLASVPDAAYDGVLCWAVLMHLPEEFLFDALFNLRRILKPGGRLLISTPLIGPTVDSCSLRDPDGRLFNGVTPENFHFLLEKVGFHRINRWDEEDSLGRTDRRWATQLFVLEGRGSRSLDQIESILNRDKKDATYKPALFRALAELATTSYHSARWLPEGRVAIPIGSIADKWLGYFWPLFESETFIPQKRGEKPVCSKPVAFRAELAHLITLYQRMGGLSAFTVAHRANNLPSEVEALHRRLHTIICDTIRAGPVYYSGGGGSGTFSYDRESRSVVMSADLWRELSAMGNWIADATVLRWAELTAEISQGAIKPSQVIDQLLTPPIEERDVLAARSVYEGLTDKRCVWTDRTLRDQFDVDHAIPFALWHNNDLWNLLPALPAINNQKRDRLPSRDLFRSRRDCIVHYWSLLRDKHTIRFEFEMGKLAGPKAIRGGNWENRLFHTVAEAIEFTAIQRGVDRWQPPSFAWVPAVVDQSPPDARPSQATVDDDFAEPSQIILDPPTEDRFVTCVPFYDVAAAAGVFGPDQPPVDSTDHHTWVRVDNLKLNPDMFGIRVVGRSMEPKIPDGSICIFCGGEALAGTRQGRIVLVALRDSVDPETGGRLTVKRYHSEKRFDSDGQFAHTRITLRPLNPDFEPIVIDRAEDDQLRFLGEFVGRIVE